MGNFDEGEINEVELRSLLDTLTALVNDYHDVRLFYEKYAAGSHIRDETLYGFHFLLLASP